VITIEDNAFTECRKLTNLNFPLTITINSGAFSYCDNLTEIKFQSLETININAFWGCSKLKYVTLPSLKKIKERTFGICNDLISIELPLISSIGDMAFVSCNNLQTISLGTEHKTLTTITLGNNVFYGVNTTNIDLILGETVIPIPNLLNNSWNYEYYNDEEQINYYWKTITVKPLGIEEFIKNKQISIFPNPVKESINLFFKLETSCYLKILLIDLIGEQSIEINNSFVIDGIFQKTIYLETFPKGVYLLYFYINDNIFLEKIVVE